MSFFGSHWYSDEQIAAHEQSLDDSERAEEQAEGLFYLAHLDNGELVIESPSENWESLAEALPPFARWLDECADSDAGHGGNTAGAIRIVRGFVARTVVCDPVGFGVLTENDWVREQAIGELVR